MIAKRILVSTFQAGPRRSLGVTHLMHNRKLRAPALTQRAKSSIPFPTSKENGTSMVKESHYDEKEIHQIPNFSHPQATYNSKTTSELLRAMVVFQICRIPPLVRNAERILKASKAILGQSITDSLLKATFFGHFCAGEDVEEIRPVLSMMEKNGVGGILDYAAEDDGSNSFSSSARSQPPGQLSCTTTPPAAVIQRHVSGPKVRMYDYESEKQCDRHVDVFLKCIQNVSELGSDGYAAVKVTALGNPKLLERMSRAILESKKLYARFDQDRDGMLSRQDFEMGYQQFFHGTEQDLNDMLDKLDPHGTGIVDLITWSMMLSPSDLPSITKSCRRQGPLSLATPTEEEVELIEAMFERAHVLAQEAVKCGTRLLIDAEQARFQPAIDNLVLALQQTYNDKRTTDFPIIYNTYQCYLKDTPERIRMDLERSKRFNYHFGVKLVRGAYMEGERALAALLNYPSPIHETVQETHDCYNDAVEYLLQKSVSSDYPNNIELMLATHNVESVEKAIHVMKDNQINPDNSTVCFAQLFGMSDNITYNLGRTGYRAYKYVPYGKVSEVMPYLIRRAMENSSVAGGASQEIPMLVSELTRRTGMA